jgi:hypothetical protein
LIALFESKNNQKMPSELQYSINERIKFIIDKLGMSVRGFSAELGVSDTNTRNYIDRGSKPNSDYLQKVLRRFDSINPTWLLLGDGEPFIGEALSPPVSITNKKNKGPVQNNTGDHNTITNNLKLEDCQRDLASMQKEAAAYQREIELLKGQLEAKDNLIASKDELLNFLRSGFNRPN